MGILPISGVFTNPLVCTITTLRHSKSLHMNKSLKLSSLLIAGTLAPSFSAHAASITVTAAAPTVDEADIAQLSFGASHTGDSGDLWSDRGAQGQSFTTGGNALGYSLDAFFFRSNQAQASVQVITFRVVTVTGDDFTLVTTASANRNSAVAVGDWVTASFDSPVTLAANTVYAIDFQDTSGSGVYVGWRLSGSAESILDGGVAYTSGLNDSEPATTPLDDANLTLRTFDRTFHVNLVAAVPEPSSAALLGLGGIALIIRRRR